MFLRNFFFSFFQFTMTQRLFVGRLKRFSMSSNGKKGKMDHSLISFTRFRHTHTLNFKRLPHYTCHNWITFLHSRFSICWGGKKPLNLYRNISALPAIHPPWWWWHKQVLPWFPAQFSHKCILYRITISHLFVIDYFWIASALFGMKIIIFFFHVRFHKESIIILVYVDKQFWCTQLVHRFAYVW